MNGVEESSWSENLPTLPSLKIMIDTAAEEEE
jgi:hypothetical protein